MDELIERLRTFVVERGKIARGSDIVTACNNSALSLSDLRALLAALEAAREDANLVYRMIPTLPVTPETCEQATDALTQFCLSFHAAIDQARGKGVSDEA